MREFHQRQRQGWVLTVLLESKSVPLAKCESLFRTGNASGQPARFFHTEEFGDGCGSLGNHKTLDFTTTPRCDAISQCVQLATSTLGHFCKLSLWFHFASLASFSFPEALSDSDVSKVADELSRCCRPKSPSVGLPSFLANSGEPTPSARKRQAHVFG